MFSTEYHKKSMFSTEYTQAKQLKIYRNEKCKKYLRNEGGGE